MERGAERAGRGQAVAVARLWAGGMLPWLFLLAALPIPVPVLSSKYDEAADRQESIRNVV